MANDRQYDYEGFNTLENENNEAINNDQYREETAAELDAPIRAVNEEDRKTTENLEQANSRTMGYVALALSIISLFVLPVLLGAAGIIVGFMARRRGAQTLGNWAVGIGIVSVLLGIFVLPFF